MTAIKRTYPLAEFSRIEDAFDKFTNRFFSEFFPARWERGELLPEVDWIPSVDLIERKDYLLLRAEVPGIKKEDIDISVTDTNVTIKGELKREEEEKGDTYYWCERGYGSFGRTVKLPREIDTNKVEASLKGGILELKLPKKEAKKAKIVEVKVK
jgi:HSP20 family protein